jgi:hypothetical protein
MKRRTIETMTERWCGCMAKQTAVSALRDIRDEVRELIAEPSMDEFSDICYGVGRLVGALINKPYVPMPWDGRHIAKIEERMRQYGCIRSSRHLVQGKCPALETLTTGG